MIFKSVGQPDKMPSSACRHVINRLSVQPALSAGEPKLCINGINACWALMQFGATSMLKRAANKSIGHLDHCIYKLNAEAGFCFFCVLSLWSWWCVCREWPQLWCGRVGACCSHLHNLLLLLLFPSAAYSKDGALKATLRIICGVHVNAHWDWRT